MKAQQIGSLVSLITCMVLLIGGCALQEPKLPAVVEAGSERAPSVLIDSYKMAAGDQIKINVWKSPELSLAEPIRPDGKISVPLVGDVMAVGLTPEELAEIIEAQLSSYIKNPNVTIILTNIRGQSFLSRIRITGSVKKNRSLSYQPGMTVLDAVLEAGSVDVYADSNNTKLHRRTDNGTEAYDIRLKDIMHYGDMTTNVILMPGDIITVPERGF